MLSVADIRNFLLDTFWITEQARIHKTMDSYPLPPLHDAVDRSDVDLAKKIIIREDTEVNVNQLCKKGWAPLHKAVCRGLRLTKLLIEHGADVNLKTSYGLSPLMAATGCGTVDTCEIYRLLLENGADCNEINFRGTTPLFSDLANSSSLESAKLSISYGADIRAVDKVGMTALHYAAKNPLVQKMKFILDQGFDVECVTRSNYSALHYAAYHSNPEVCEYLLNHGAMVNRRDSMEYTPLHLARMRGIIDSNWERTAQILRKYGAHDCHTVRV